MYFTEYMSVWVSFFQTVAQFPVWHIKSKTWLFNKVNHTFLPWLRGVYLQHKKLRKKNVILAAKPPVKKSIFHQSINSLKDANEDEFLRPECQILA